MSNWISDLARDLFLVRIPASGICLLGLKETMTNLSPDGWYPSQDSNPAPPEKNRYYHMIRLCSLGLIRVLIPTLRLCCLNYLNPRTTRCSCASLFHLCPEHFPVLVLPLTTVQRLHQDYNANVVRKVKPRSADAIPVMVFVTVPSC